MPKTLLDTITQSDLAAAVAAHRLSNTLMWNLRQRVLKCADVEAGHYSIATDGDEMPPTEFDGFYQLGVTITIDRKIPELLFT